MHIVDSHCDALLKLQLAKRDLNEPEKRLSFKDDKTLDVNYERLRIGNVKVQFFAVFIEPDVPSDEKWQHALEQIDLFYTEVIGKHKLIKHIRKWGDIEKLQTGEIGAVLTLEGAEAFGNDRVKLRHLYRLGVMSIGLMWNDANLCGDGVGEPRRSGLTTFGKEVVKLNNEHRVLTDVSHASEKSFWEMVELGQYVFASHSNARAICDHPRNLYDDQLQALFAKGGFVHVVFYPPFIKTGHEKVTISDLIKHIDHLCARGGVDKVGFGSDFDGIDQHVLDLQHAGNYEYLTNELLKYYSESEVRGFASENFLKNIENLTEG